MSITTKRGDEGFTDLLFGGKAAKGSEQIEALGAVDELNAVLGMARVVMMGEVAEMVDEVQKNLVNLMGELAMPVGKEKEYDRAGFKRIEEGDLSRLEGWSSGLEGEGRFRGWLRPGASGGELAARLHLARTVARRAERRVWGLSEELASFPVKIFLNRLSDLLWLMADQSGELSE